MFNLTKLFAVVCSAVLIISMASCGGPDGAAAVTGVEASIPSSATGVMLMNTKQLLDKADFETLKQAEFYKEWIKTAEKDAPEVAPFLEDPESAGISLGSNMALYFSPAKDYAESGKMDAAFILPIADKAKLAEAIKKAAKDATPEEKDGYTLVKLEKDMKLVYNDKIFAAVSFDDEEKIKAILNGSGENINSNASFAKHLKEGKDFMFWMDADPLVETYMANPMNKMMLSGALGTAGIPMEGLKGNYMSFYYDFKDGEIDGGASFDFSEPLKAELGDLLPAKLSVDYSKYIPAENLAAAAALGINSEGVLAFLAKRGYDKIADGQLAAADLDLGKINDGITGDLAIGVYAPASEGAIPTVVLALGLKDKAFAEGLVGKLGPFVKKEGDLYVMTGGRPMDPNEKPQQAFASIQDEVLLISNDKAQVEKAIAGGKNDAVAELQEGWMGLFLDYALIEQHHEQLASYIPTDPGSLEMSKMMHQYNELTSVKVLMKDNHIDTKVGLKTTDMNSLKRLIQVADRLFKDREKIKAEMDKHIGGDEFDGFDEEFEEEEGKENT